MKPFLILPHRVHRGKGRLVPVRLIGKHMREHPVVPFGQLIQRAEIRRQMKHLSAPLFDLFLHQVVGVDIGPPEPEDGLLRIAHQKQRSGPRNELVPVLLLHIRPCQIKQNLCLDGVCVLELIDQDVGIPPAEILPDLGIVPQEL